jgi:DNA-binding transcriptional LysR family regulator
LIEWGSFFGAAMPQLRCGNLGRLKVSAAEGLRKAVFARFGIAITSEWNLAPELASGIVTSVLNDRELPTLDLWAVHPTGRMASAKAREFASFVETCIPTPWREPLKKAQTA